MQIFFSWFLVIACVYRWWSISSGHFQEFTNNFPEVFHKPFHDNAKTWTIPSRSDWTGWMMIMICRLTCYCHDDGDHHNQRDLDFFLGRMGMWCVMLRCEFWNQMKSVQVPSTSVALTFLEIWKMFSNIAWWTCAQLKVARLDQESECAQWISLAKHIVVKLTTSKAMTKRPSSILFHWSWQSRSRKSQQGLATTLFFIVFPKTLAKFW